MSQIISGVTSAIFVITGRHAASGHGSPGDHRTCLVHCRRNNRGSFVPAEGLARGRVGVLRRSCLGALRTSSSIAGRRRHRERVASGGADPPIFPPMPRSQAQSEYRISRLEFRAPA